MVVGSLLLLLLAQMLPSFVFFQRPEYYTSLHSVLEIASIVVAAMVAVIAWASPVPDARSSLAAVLAGGFMAVALLDVGHMLSYQGMPDLVTPSGPEKAINFWLAARVAAAFALLATAMMVGRRLPVTRAVWVGGALAYTALVYLTVLYMPEVYPRTFDAVEGLSTFKVGAEYLLVSLFLLAAWLFYRNHAGLPSRAARQLAVAAWMMALAELYFTVYQDVTDVFNLLGHVHKLVADFFVFRAVAQASLNDPYLDLDRSQRNLRRVESDLREALDLLPDTLFFYSTRHPVGFTYVSAAVTRTLGYTPDEHYRNPFLGLDRVHPDDRRFLEIAMASNPPPARTELRWINHKGEAVWIEHALAPRYDDAGELIGVVGSGRDVTTRRLMEDRLRASEKLHRSVLATLSEGVVIHGVDGQILQVNPAAERLLGLSQMLILGGENEAPGWQAIHEDGSLFESSEHPTMETLRSGKVRRGVLMGIRRAAGGTSWIRVNTDPWVEPGSSAIAGVVTTFRDVTDEERHRRALETRYGHVSVAQSMIGCGSWSWDLATGQVDWSPGIYRLFGLAPDTPSRLQRIWRYIHPQDRASLREQLMRLRLGGGARQLEFRLRQKNGGERRIISTCRLVRSNGGGVRQAIGALQDVTEQSHILGGDADAGQIHA